MAFGKPAGDMTHGLILLTKHPINKAINESTLGGSLVSPQVLSSHVVLDGHTNVLTVGKQKVYAYWGLILPRYLYTRKQMNFLSLPITELKPLC